MSLPSCRLFMVVLFLSVGLLAGCGTSLDLGGLTMADLAGGRTTTLTLRAGESRVVLSPPGVRGMPGGWRAGLVSDQPEVATIRFGNDDPMSESAAVVALRPGVCRVYLINAYQLRLNPQSREGITPRTPYFTVEVVASDRR